MRRLTAAAALVAVLLAGCGGSGGEEGLTARIEEDPFRVTVVSGGEPVVEQALDGRLRYRLDSGAEHRLTRVASSVDGVYRVETDEPGRTASVTVSNTPVSVRVQVQLEPQDGVAEVYDSYETGPDEHFLGGGEQGAAVDLRGRVLAGKVSWYCTHVPIPYVASSGGWGVRIETQHVYALALPGSAGGSGCQFTERPACSFPALADRVEVCVRGSRLDLDFFAGSLDGMLRDYVTLAGKPAAAPPGQFELIKWRDENAHQDELLEDVDRLRAAGIPVGWVILDNPWEPCIGEMTFDPNRIPDPEGLVRDLAARNARLMLWVAPKVTCQAGYPADAILSGQGQQTLDLRRPEIMAEFRKRIRRLVEMGVAGFKGDRADEVDLESLGPAYHNLYPLLFAGAVMAEAPRDAAVILRAATTGSQAVLPGIWAGDQPGDWIGLQRAIRMGQTAAMSGFPTWGSDVGGYSSAHLTGDVFARWAQLGAISPVMEVGGIGPHATPWVLGDEAMEALRRAAVLHYELYPTFRAAIDAGEPVLRPLGYAFPDDAEAWGADLQLMVGPDLLAAPVAGQGTTPSIYLPAGRWVDLHTGGTVEGGEAFIRSTPMTDLPLYVRDGAVVPFNARTAADPWWGVDELEHPGRAGFIATDGAVLDLAGQPAGVQLLVPTPVRPGGVTLDGRPVEWTWSPGPMPGAVVRLPGPEVRGELRLSGP